MNLKEKNYLYVTLILKDVQTKKLKPSDWLFFHLPLVTMTPVVSSWSVWISPWIFGKNLNGPNGIRRGLGETDSWNKPEVENLVALSLVCRVFRKGVCPSEPRNVITSNKSITSKFIDSAILNNYVNLFFNTIIYRSPVRQRYIIMHSLRLYLFIEL